MERIPALDIRLGRQRLCRERASVATGTFKIPVRVDLPGYDVRPFPGAAKIAALDKIHADLGVHTRVHRVALTPRLQIVPFGSNDDVARDVHHRRLQVVARHQRILVVVVVNQRISPGHKRAADRGDHPLFAFRLNGRRCAANDDGVARLPADRNACQHARGVPLHRRAAGFRAHSRVADRTEHLTLAVDDDTASHEGRIAGDVDVGVLETVGRAIVPSRHNPLMNAICLHRVQERAVRKRARPGHQHRFEKHAGGEAGIGCQRPVDAQPIQTQARLVPVVSDIDPVWYQNARAVRWHVTAQPCCRV